MHCAYISVPKFKYVVITHVDIEDDLILGFYINSKVHRLIKANPELERCQLILSQKKYTFLKYDSFLDCSKVQVPFGCDELAEHLSDKPTELKGNLLDEEIKDVVQIVHTARTISTIDKDLIIGSFAK